jgi:hypothetical protein
MRGRYRFSRRKEVLADPFGNLFIATEYVAMAGLAAIAEP